MASQGRASCRAHRDEQWNGHRRLIPDTEQLSIRVLLEPAPGTCEVPGSFWSKRTKFKTYEEALGFLRDRIHSDSLFPLDGVR